MQERGLIERRNHPTDRRYSLLFLTPAAHPLLQFMRTIGEQTRQETMADFSIQEHDQLLQYLERMREHLLTACGQPVDELTGCAASEVKHG
ncbi:hypothetical protein D9M71_732370 [compost metagenome]